MFVGSEAAREPSASRSLVVSLFALAGSALAWAASILPVSRDESSERRNVARIAGANSPATAMTESSILSPA